MYPTFEERAEDREAQMRAEHDALKREICGCVSALLIAAVRVDMSAKSACAAASARGLSTYYDGYERVMVY